MATRHFLSLKDFEPEELKRLVERHRQNVNVEIIDYAHLPGLASEESKRRNLEVLVRAGKGR